MAELENKGKFGPVHIFTASMGDRTIKTISDHSGRRTGPVYENEILKGDLVKLIGPKTVAKCDAGDANAIGIAIADYDHEGALPTTDAGDGEYDNTYVRVEVFGKVIKSVHLEASNSAITAGDKIKVGTTTVGCYDKGTSSNNTIALQDAKANSGDIIEVLFGYYPI